MRITVNSKEEAWDEVNKIVPTGYEKDCIASERAGYPIYKQPTFDYLAFDPYIRICDLGDRIEILTGKYSEDIINIWIEPIILSDIGTNMSQADYERLCGRVDIKTWKMTDEAAKILVNDEFGFEVSRIKIISEVETYIKEGNTAKVYQKFTRPPQYCATDYNYVRFNVGIWQYEMINGSLHFYYS